MNRAQATRRVKIVYIEGIDQCCVYDYYHQPRFEEHSCQRRADVEVNMGEVVLTVLSVAQLLDHKDPARGCMATLHAACQSTWTMACHSREWTLSVFQLRLSIPIAYDR